MFSRQRISVELEKKSVTFTALQERFRNISKEKQDKDAKLKETYSLLEESMGDCEKYAQQ